MTCETLILRVAIGLIQDVRSQAEILMNSGRHAQLRVNFLESLWISLLSIPFDAVTGWM